MGSLLSGIFIRQMAEDFIDQLQGEGFQQLKNKKFSFGGWNPKTTFGYADLRNQAFKDLQDHLVGPFKKGLKMANISPGSTNMLMTNYVSGYLIYHVMRCLLKEQGAANPEPKYSGLPLQSLLGMPILPEYDVQALTAFKTTWTTLQNGRIISLDTTDEVEKEVLSALLAVKVIDVVKTIDIGQFVANALNAFAAQKVQEAQNRHGLFAQTGNAAALERTRKEYTQEQQEHEAKEQIKEDLVVGMF